MNLKMTIMNKIQTGIKE